MIEYILLQFYIFLTHGIMSVSIFNLIGVYFKNVNHLVMAYMMFAYYLLFGSMSTIFYSMWTLTLYLLYTDPNTIQKMRNLYDQFTVSENVYIVKTRDVSNMVFLYYKKYMKFVKSYTLDYVDKFLQSDNGRAFKEFVKKFYDQYIVYKTQFETYISSRLHNMNENEFVQAMNKNTLPQAPPVDINDLMSSPVTVDVDVASIPTVPLVPTLQNAMNPLNTTNPMNPMNNLFNLGNNVKLMGDQMSTMKNMMDELKRLEDTVNSQKKRKAQ